jgi:rubrerythrin
LSLSRIPHRYKRLAQTAGGGRVLIIATMSDTDPPHRPLTPLKVPNGPGSVRDPEKMLCDRCGAEMYRMHAVWRCPECGFKTDCCGW